MHFIYELDIVVGNIFSKGKKVILYIKTTTQFGKMTFDRTFVKYILDSNSKSNICEIVSIAPVSKGTCLKLRNRDKLSKYLLDTCSTFMFLV